MAALLLMLIWNTNGMGSRMLRSRMADSELSWLLGDLSYC